MASGATLKQYFDPWIFFSQSINFILERERSYKYLLGNQHTEKRSKRKFPQLFHILFVPQAYLHYYNLGAIFHHYIRFISITRYKYWKTKCLT